MFKAIEKLQRQPEYIRKQVSLIISGVVVFIIAVFWIMSLNTTFTPQTTTISSDTQNIISEIEKNIAPFTLLKEQFGQLFQQ